MFLQFNIYNFLRKLPHQIISHEIIISLVTPHNSQQSLHKVYLNILDQNITLSRFHNVRFLKSIKSVYI